MKNEKGNLLAVAICEMVVFFTATFGFSDFVFNTAIIKKTNWVEDTYIPGTLVTADLIPGMFIALTYLMGSLSYDKKSLILCVIAAGLGSFFGSRMVVNVDTARIKKVIGFAMIFSMAALVVKLIVSSGISEGASGLSTKQLIFTLPVIFIFGALNMMGVGLKPPLMSLFLLLGLSPIATLTILMAIALTTPTIGCITFFKSEKYSKKFFVCAATVGSLASIVGSFFALNMNPLILTVTMIVAMAYVSFTMFKK